MDTGLMPVYLFDNHYDTFLIHVELSLGKQEQVTLLAMKSMVFGRVFERTKELNPSSLTPEDLHGRPIHYQSPACSVYVRR